MSFEPQLIGYLAGLLTTLSFLPQAIKTLRTRHTESISLTMYAMFCAGVFLWLVYGLVIGDNTLILANSITLFLASPILIMKARQVAKSKS